MDRNRCSLDIFSDKYEKYVWSLFYKGVRGSVYENYELDIFSYRCCFGLNSSYWVYYGYRQE